ncbi:MFS transporter [Nonomuraea monospora]|uniref:MFS transporter n=1 Tax=Nonomuraea monospora TaxID=568818 RepID=A0ABN3D5S0_9ACTN
MTGALLRSADFLKFWTAQCVSQAGSQISVIAFPLLAVLTLHADAFQVGVLTALSRAPWLLFALPAGVLADRRARHGLLVGADLVRAAALAWIPVAALLGVLSVEQLYVVTFVLGSMTVVFDIAAQSYLPAITPAERLADGNSKLEMSRAGAEAVGPSAGGVLVQLVSAPVTIVLDLVSFLVSALLLSRIRTKEPAVAAPARASSIRAEVKEGLRFVLGHRLLRWNVIAAATANFFGNMLLAVQVLFILNGLGLRPALIGLILGVGSLGAVSGAAVATTLIRRAGFGPTLIIGLATTAAGGVVLGLAGGPYPMRVGLAGLAATLLVFGVPLFDVAVVTLRQLITPGRLLGRVNASMRFLIFGTMPVGALAGGLLAQHAGLRTAVLVAGAGLAVPVVLLLISPLARLRTDVRSSSAAMDVAASTGGK